MMHAQRSRGVRLDVDFEGNALNVALILLRSRAAANNRS